MNTLNSKILRATSPLKVILFGEHAVVYDKLGVAAAIDRRIGYSVTDGNGGTEFVLNHPRSVILKISREEIEGKLREFRRLRDANDIEGLKRLDFRSALAVVLGEVFERHGYRDVRIVQDYRELFKGLGGSAANFSSIALATASFIGKYPSRKELYDISCVGDCVAHGGTASGIDSSIVTYGGYIKYRKSKGLEFFKADFCAPLIVVNSGNRTVSTGELISRVRAFKEREPRTVDNILDRAETIAVAGLETLENGDATMLGQLMFENHELLRRLGVSTARLDEIVDMARRNGALGAKLTGAGGGGCAIVLPKNLDNGSALTHFYKRAGFGTFMANLGAEGVKIEDL